LATTRNKGFFGIGLDPNIEISLKAAKNSSKRSNVVYALLKGVGETIPLASSTVSVLMCNSMLDHTLDADGVVKEINRVLKDNGIVVFWQGIYNDNKSHSTKEEETHLRSFDCEGLIKLFEKGHFSLVESRLLGLDFLSSSSTNRSMALKIPKSARILTETFVQMYLFLGKFLPQHAAIAMFSFKKGKLKTQTEH
jgi:SAM-dependent methyltransferase